jgi:hypothetical protein
MLSYKLINHIQEPMTSPLPISDGGMVPSWKIIVWLLLGNFSLLPRLSPAQGVPDLPGQAFRHVISTVPLQPEEINLSYERVYRENRSWQMGLGYIHHIHLNQEAFVPTPHDGNGVSIRLSTRRYTSSRFAAPEGFHHGPRAVYRYMAFKENTYLNEQNRLVRDQLTLHVASLQYLVGFQRIFWRWLAVGAYAGVGGRLKYAFEQDPERDPSFRVIGRSLASGPNWTLEAVPSLHLNASVGVAF